MVGKQKLLEVRDVLHLPGAPVGAGGSSLGWKAGQSRA